MSLLSDFPTQESQFTIHENLMRQLKEDVRRSGGFCIGMVVFTPGLRAHLCPCYIRDSMFERQPAPNFGTNLAALVGAPNFFPICRARNKADPGYHRRPQCLGLSFLHGQATVAPNACRWTKPTPLMLMRLCHWMNQKSPLEIPLLIQPLGTEHPHMQTLPHHASRRCRTKLSLLLLARPL